MKTKLRSLSDYQESIARQMLGEIRKTWPSTGFHAEYSQKYYDSPAKMINDITVFKSLRTIKQVLKNNPEFQESIKDYLGL